MSKKRNRNKKYKKIKRDVKLDYKAKYINDVVKFINDMYVNKNPNTIIKREFDDELICEVIDTIFVIITSHKD